MKSVKLTFWLIGFGCGIIIAGIAGALITINVSGDEKNTVAGEVAVMSQEKSQVIEEEIPPHNEEIIQPNLLQNQAVNEEEVEQIEISEEEIENAPNQADRFYEITIPSNVTASQICMMLQEHGIIENSDEFLAYIKERKKQTLLKSGRYKLPVGGTYEEILEELLL